MHEIHTPEDLTAWLDHNGSLRGVAIQAVDGRHETARLNSVAVDGALFLGCTLDAGVLAALPARGAIVMPKLTDFPFEPLRNALYHRDELFAGIRADDPCSYCDTPDAKIHRYWRDTGKAAPPSILDALSRRLHDFSISDALEEFLLAHRRPQVVIMGGHGMRRDDPTYAEVVEIAATMTRAGRLMISGGGPGAMEATHVGAYFANMGVAERRQVIDGLAAAAPTYRDRDWLTSAFRMLEQHPQGDDRGESLGIPTWLYGHEPPTPFASHIAKYFANSVREEGLVTLGHDGIVFAPGSAGTIQEIFQDAAQNHYATTGFACPMVFLGRDYWTREKPVYPLLKELARSKPYGALLGIVDTGQEVIDFLEAHRPSEEAGGEWSFCAAHCGEEHATPRGSSDVLS